MSDKQKQEKIIFIDPNDLIGFVQEGTEDDIDMDNASDDSSSEKGIINTTTLSDDDDNFLTEDELTELFEKKYSKEIDEIKILKKRENTRGVLAVLYTMLTFLIFGIGMLVATLDGLNRDVSIIDNMQEILPLLSGIFLGSLGFVLGYYFRKGDE